MDMNEILRRRADVLFHTERINEISSNSGVKRTLQPITTGTSVLGVKFDGGVMIAADSLGAYGSLARYRKCERVMAVNKYTALAADGDYADFQFLSSIIEQNVIDEDCLGDGFNQKPNSLYCWLTRVLYNRRSKFDPLWNTYIVGGLQDGVPFLGCIDKLGTAFEAPTVATGYGAYIAQPLLREAYEKNDKMSKEEAKELLHKCLSVLFCRDTHAHNKYHIVSVTDEGSKVEGPFELKVDWKICEYVKGYE